MATTDSVLLMEHSHQLAIEELFREVSVEQFVEGHRTALDSLTLVTVVLVIYMRLIQLVLMALSTNQEVLRQQQRMTL